MAVVHAGPGPTWLALILAGLSAAGTLYIEYTHNDRDNAQRISALEAHRADDAGKIDHIQSQVDKLVDWAMGKQ